MTTYIDFKPSDTAIFQFQATLDGALYNCACPYNIFGQRYYFRVYDSSMNLILSVPMVGSPLDYDISLTAGYFVTKVIFRQSNQQFEII